MCSVKTCDKEYLNFISINSAELVAKWASLTDEQQAKHGADPKVGYTHFLRTEWDNFQNGETKYK